MSDRERESMGPSRRLERVTLLEALVKQLEEEILSGELANGVRLPSEEALANDFGVSRPIVREALSLLRERGYLYTVSGSGTFVRHSTTEQLADALVRHMRLAVHQGFTVDNLYEARAAIELTCARLAATRAGEAELAALEARLEDMRRDRDDRARYTAADVGFHVAVAEATGNPFLTALLPPLVKIIVHGMFESQRRPDAAELGIRAHTTVLERIRAHDPDGAALAMEQHLAESRKIFPDEVVEGIHPTLD